MLLLVKRKGSSEGTKSYRPRRRETLTGSKVTIIEERRGKVEEEICGSLDESHETSK